MAYILIFIGVVICLCLLLNHFADKLPVPSIIIFLGLGMIFGIDGIFKIPSDNYEYSEMVCSIALIFIMVYGGFSTNIKAAKPVA